VIGQDHARARLDLFNQLAKVGAPGADGNRDRIHVQMFAHNFDCVKNGVFRRCAGVHLNSSPGARFRTGVKTPNVSSSSFSPSSSSSKSPEKIEDEDEKDDEDEPKRGFSTPVPPNAARRNSLHSGKLSRCPPCADLFLLSLDKSADL
jgi:hypothetical protein